MRTAALTLAPRIGPLYWLSAASSAAENVAEDITEDVSHIGSIEIEAAKSTGTAACAALKGRMAKLVILSSLLRIA